MKAASGFGVGGTLVNEGRVVGVAVVIRIEPRVDSLCV
jgi:hypothetical protein